MNDPWPAYYSSTSPDCQECGHEWFDHHEDHGCQMCFYQGGPCYG